MTNNLIEKKERLIQLKYEYKEQLQSIEKELDIVQNQIYEQCAIKNNGHKWIREREAGIYGETFFYCKYCGCGE